MRDFDSTNGTILDEVPVKGEVPLNHDSILKIGPLTFKVVIEKTAPIDKPTPPPAKKAAGSEEDIADMLLALQEEETETASDEEADVPGGSTVMDIPSLPSMTLGVRQGGYACGTINDAAPANRRT